MVCAAPLDDTPISPGNKCNEARQLRLEECSRQLSTWQLYEISPVQLTFSCPHGWRPPVRIPQTKGPIQLYDIHGKLICQLHGQNPQLSCLDKNAEQRQFAAYFIDYAVGELASDLHVNIVDLPSYGLNVSTTLDLDLHKHILQTAQQYIAKMKNTHHMSNAAVVMLDYHTGAIRSFVGSLDSPAAVNPLNVITQTARQVGSAFKPFVYANAFAQGISPGEVFYDGPFSVGGPYGYAPLQL
jgi:membrane peptidoglycan carboxypeptidase